MGIRDDVRTFLLADTDVSAITTNVVWAFLPQMEDGYSTPFIWYTRTSEEDELDLDGTVSTLQIRRFALECVSTDPAEAVELADAVRTALHGYDGAFGDATVQLVTVDDADDDYIARNVAEDGGFYVVALNLEIYEDLT